MSGRASTETPPNPTPEKPLDKGDIRRIHSYIKDETDGAALYRALAKAEQDERLSGVYGRLAETEDRHRAVWEEKLRRAGHEVPAYRRSWRVVVMSWIASRFGANSVSNIVSRMESDAYQMYDAEPDAIAAGLPADERSHARLFREIARDNVPGEAIDIAGFERRHQGVSGNAIRAAVLGANDGLVSNLSLVMGVAGAASGGNIVMVTGVAGLFAGALSMALGEWISVQNSAEYYRRQVKVERDELTEMPEEEREELVLIYQAKGFDEATARRMADRVFSNNELALATLTREELGLGEDDEANPWTAAIVSFCTFSVGALMPVLPWFFLDGNEAIPGSLLLSGFGLAATGGIITLFTGRGVLFSAGRMLLFGMAAAAITYAIGSAIGAAAL